ncbi:MAG: PilZ domain-containing protein [Candidatus Omnitrophota bacterium]
MNSNDHKHVSGEHRKSARVETPFVEYILQEKPCAKKSGFANNISASGVCLLLSEYVKVNACVSLTIYLIDGGKPIDVKGKVIWVKPSPVSKNRHEAGIEYMDLHKKDQERILLYVIRALNTKTCLATIDSPV